MSFAKLAPRGGVYVRARSAHADAFNERPVENFLDFDLSFRACPFFRDFPRLKPTRASGGAIRISPSRGPVLSGDATRCFLRRINAHVIADVITLACARVIYRSYSPRFRNR